MDDNSRYRAIIPAGGCGKRLANLGRDRPKSFLEINGKKLIEYTLDYLSERGISDATIAVGYMKEYFMETIGRKRGNLNVEYAVSENYETGGHGWGIYVTRESWAKDKKDVLWIDADNFYEPAILDNLINFDGGNVVIVDENPRNKDLEEELILGRSGVVAGFKRGIHSKEDESVGEFLGMSKFSRNFMNGLYDYMEKYFKEKGWNHKYERVLNEFIRDTGGKILYADCGKSFLININTEEDYKIAKELQRRIK